MKRVVSKLLNLNTFYLSMKIGNTLNEKGYAKKWFTWIEWVTLSIAMIAVGFKVKSPIVILLGVGSVLMVFFSGFASAHSILNDIEYLRNRPKLGLYISMSITVFSILIIDIIFKAFFKGSNIDMLTK